MSRKHSTSDSILLAEACSWLAQLDGAGMSRQDQEAFREWLHRSPAHEAKIKQVAATWGEMNVLTELMEPIAIAHKNEEALFQGRRTAWRPILAATAVIFAIFLTVIMPTILTDPGDTGDNVQQYATIIGENRILNLADQTKVTLNTNTEIVVKYLPDERRVHLRRGEAIFDVTHDKDRPFTVYVGNRAITAVGTIFAVKREDDTSVGVSVTEGAVEVALIDLEDVGSIEAAIKAPITRTVRPAGFVKSGHKARLVANLTQIEPVTTAEIEASLSWKDGLLSFNGESLEDVVAEVSRYTALEISISDPDIRNIRIGGYFPSGDMNLLFEALGTGFGVEADQSELGKVYLKRASGTHEQ